MPETLTDFVQKIKTALIITIKMECLFALPSGVRCGTVLIKKPYFFFAHLARDLTDAQGVLLAGEHDRVG